MVDLEYLSQLLVLLREQGVSSFKSTGLSLKFHVELNPIDDEEIWLKSSKPEEPKDEVKIQEVPINEEALPPDLRTDNITDYDKILNWSGSPDLGDQPELPLTGDAPLEGL